MNLLETFSEKVEPIKHSPKDILLFSLLILSVLNLYLYFKFVDSGKKTEIVINSASDNGEVAGDQSQIPVYISGAVNFPGVYAVESGSLVSDVARLAGGFSASANALWVSKSLNLSEKLDPNSKIYVPFVWDTEYVLSATIEDAAASADTADEDSSGDDQSTPDDGKVNVNTATLAELDEQLEGIGPVYAQKIIDGRPYADLEEFKNKSGLSENLVNSLSDYVSFD